MGSRNGQAVSPSDSAGAACGARSRSRSQRATNPRTGRAGLSVRPLPRASQRLAVSGLRAAARLHRQGPVRPSWTSRAGGQGPHQQVCGLRARNHFRILPPVLGTSGPAGCAAEMLSLDVSSLRAGRGAHRGPQGPVGRDPLPIPEIAAQAYLTLIYLFCTGVKILCNLQLRKFFACLFRGDTRLR